MSSEFWAQFIGSTTPPPSLGGEGGGEGGGGEWAGGVHPTLLAFSDPVAVTNPDYSVFTSEERDLLQRVKLEWLEEKKSPHPGDMYWTGKNGWQALISMDRDASARAGYHSFAGIAHAFRWTKDAFYLYEMRDMIRTARRYHTKYVRDSDWHRVSKDYKQSGVKVYPAFETFFTNPANGKYNELNYKEDYPALVPFVQAAYYLHVNRHLDSSFDTEIAWVNEFADKTEQKFYGYRRSVMPLHHVVHMLVRGSQYAHYTSKMVALNPGARTGPPSGDSQYFAYQRGKAAWYAARRDLALTHFRNGVVYDTSNDSRYQCAYWQHINKGVRPDSTDYVINMNQYPAVLGLALADLHMERVPLALDEELQANFNGGYSYNYMKKGTYVDDDGKTQTYELFKMHAPVREGRGTYDKGARWTLTGAFSGKSITIQECGSFNTNNVGGRIVRDPNYEAKVGVLAAQGAPAYITYFPIEGGSPKNGKMYQAIANTYGDPSRSGSPWRGPSVPGGLATALIYHRLRNVEPPENVPEPEPEPEQPEFPTEPETNDPEVPTPGKTSFDRYDVSLYADPNWTATKFFTSSRSKDLAAQYAQERKESIVTMGRFNLKYLRRVPISWDGRKSSIKISDWYPNGAYEVLRRLGVKMFDTGFHLRATKDPKTLDNMVTMMAQFFDNLDFRGSPATSVKQPGNKKASERVSGRTDTLGSIYGIATSPTIFERCGHRVHLEDPLWIGGVMQAAYALWLNRHLSEDYEPWVHACRALLREHYFKAWDEYWGNDDKNENDRRYPERIRRTFTHPDACEWAGMMYYALIETDMYNAGIRDPVAVTLKGYDYNPGSYGRMFMRSVNHSLRLDPTTSSNPRSHVFWKAAIKGFNNWRTSRTCQYFAPSEYTDSSKRGTHDEGSVVWTQGNAGAGATTNFFAQNSTYHNSTSPCLFSLYLEGAMLDAFGDDKAAMDLWVKRVCNGYNVGMFAETQDTGRVRGSPLGPYDVRRDSSGKLLSWKSSFNKRSSISGGKLEYDAASKYCPDTYLVPMVFDHTDEMVKVANKLRATQNGPKNGSTALLLMREARKYGRATGFTI